MAAPVVTDAVRAEAARLRAQGYGHKRIARALGVSPSTALRIQNPAVAERARILSRDAKRRRHGTCSRCGAKTPYHGKGKTVSDLCARCALPDTVTRAQARRGTGPMQPRALAFLAQPRRRCEIGDELGVSEQYLAQLVHRLLRYGLIVRLSHGVYIAAAQHEEAA